MTPDDPSAARPSRLGHALVALLYLALVLWVQRSILDRPGVMVPMPTANTTNNTGVVYQGDQRFVVGTIATNVQKLLRDPREIAGYGFCYPLRASYTLGEHMFGESLLALPAYVATGDPILSYNVAIILSVWITALTMYALAFYWTRSIPAAFVAGMLFSFHAAKISNPGHPFVHGNLWTPLALLFAHLLFTRGRWRDAIGLTTAICLQLLESFYQVLALAVLGGTYGLVLAVRHRRALPALLPKIALVVVVSAIATWLVLGPYLHARDLWGVLKGREGTLLWFARDYLPGRAATVGAVALVLGVLGLADRLRGPRRVAGEDPRLVLTVGGALLLWCSIYPIRVRSLGWVIPNPLSLLEAIVPGLDAVRVLAALRFGVYLVVALLAAYGVVLLVERLGPRLRAAVAALLALLVMAEAYDSTRTLTPRSADLTAYRIYPAGQEIELLKNLPDGAVLDLPFSFEAAGKLVDMPYFITLAAYHQRPVAACYNSFPTPLQKEITDLTGRLPDRAAADALYAIGFRTLLVHGHRMSQGAWAKMAPLLQDETRIAMIGQGEKVVRFDLTSPLPVDATFRALTPVDSGPPADLAAAGGPVEFRFANGGSATYRHPTMEPLPLGARWRDAAGAEIALASARGMLPLALAPGDGTVRALELESPGLAGGTYSVEIVPADDPDLVLAKRQVRIP